MADKRVGQNLSENFRMNEKIFWRGLNGERKSREQMEVRIMGMGGYVVTEEEDGMNIMSNC